MNKARVTLLLIAGLLLLASGLFAQSLLDNPDYKKGVDLRRQAQEAVLVLEKRITDTWHQLLVRNADYARDASLWQVRTEPVQPYLGPETALLEYATCQGQLVAFVVTGERIDAHRVTGDMDQVQRLIRLLWLNLRAVPGGTLRQTAQRAANAQGLLRRLHDLLVAPLSAALRPYPRLIVVPHGSLHYLPFQALYDGTSFLVEQHEISYLPGASLLRYCVEAEPVDAGLCLEGCQQRRQDRCVAERAVPRATLEPVALDQRVEIVARVLAEQ